MRVYISIDMEGVAGVSDFHHVDRGGQGDYESMRALMIAEANAAVDGAFAGGATSVVVNDAHGDMANLLPAAVDRRAELQTGSGKVPDAMVTNAQDADVALFVGYHAAAGTASAVLDHSYSSAVVHRMTINGESWGECELNAAVLGASGVPVALVSGDQRVCSAAEERLPTGVRTVVVKQALANRGARSLHPDVSCDLLRTAAAEALRGPRPAPFTPPGPFRLEIEFHRTLMADTAAIAPGADRTGAYTVAISSSDILSTSRWRSVLVVLGAAALR